MDLIEVLEFFEFPNSVLEHLQGGLLESNLEKDYLFIKILELRFSICKN